MIPICVIFKKVSTGAVDDDNRIAASGHLLLWLNTIKYVKGGGVE